MSEGDDIPTEEVEESTTTDQSDVVETPRKVIKTSKTVQADYEKMARILQKQAGLKDKDLEGLSPKEKFDKLSFFVEHMPKISKNQKIVPVSPGGVAAQNVEGVTLTTNPTTGRKTYKIDLTKVYK